MHLRPLDHLHQLHPLRPPLPSHLPLPPHLPFHSLLPPPQPLRTPPQPSHRPLLLPLPLPQPHLLQLLLPLRLLLRRRRRLPSLRLATPPPPPSPPPPPRMRRRHSFHKCTNNAALADFLRSGIRVDWDDTADPYFSGCSSCRGVCGFNASDASKPFLCLPSEEVVRDHGPSGLVLLSCLFAFVCLLSIAVVATAIFLRAGGGGTSGGFDGRDPMAGFLRLPPVYTYDQLSLLTEGFDPKHKIGDGGFGSVYIARLGDGRTAAIKKLHVRPHRAAAAAADSSTRSFCNEIMILSSIDHPNLVKLHGYCCDRRGLVLVYDYVPNGTLADHLHGSRRSHHMKSSFTWPVRVDIALQTALVLEYLHYMVHPPVVHRDITSSNIFIDEDMLIKVGDFGLSRLLSPLPSDQASLGDDGAGSALDRGVWTGPQGTPGYLDPEYHRSFRLTEKSDVYSFGVVLLELVTGMRAVDPERDRKEVGLADLAVSRIQSRELRKMVDPNIMQQGGESMMGTVEAVAELAFRCVANEKDDRPDSRELVAELRRIRNWVRRTNSAADDGCKE
ncbi:putative serine/threonine-protein kinase [Acorus calamus]|uniref:Serine/threonine-protein kinase n=1 Tax=Acorus calamus TaxID=4465 RepID=A0AAV9CMB2_ACOCL|nr:putative serine/threonine-protein kinase [Acorus calamus]